MDAVINMVSGCAKPQNPIMSFRMVPFLGINRRVPRQFGMDDRELPIGLCNLPPSWWPTSACGARARPFTSSATAGIRKQGKNNASSSNNYNGASIFKQPRKNSQYGTKRSDHAACTCIK